MVRQQTWQAQRFKIFESARHFRIELHRDVQFEFESNLEASQVPSIKSVPNSLQLATGEVCDIDDIEVAHIRFAYLCLVLMLVSLFYVINVKNFHRSLIIVVRMTPLKQQISPIPFSIQKGDNT